MECVTLPNAQFALRGKCPHCLHDAAFLLVTNFYNEPVSIGNPSHVKVCGVTQCQACLGFVMAIATRVHQHPFVYQAHYPIGKPDDSVDEDITNGNKAVAADLSEAMRCRWVDAYKSTVAMCRRSLEACCEQFGASKGSLGEKIDILAAKQVITPILKDMAHRVRLEGNIGVHPQKDGLDDTTKEDADAIIGFTKELFHHLYIMPARLARYIKDAEKKPSVVLPTNGI